MLVMSKMVAASRRVVGRQMASQRRPVVSSVVLALSDAIQTPDENVHLTRHTHVRGGNRCASPVLTYAVVIGVRPQFLQR
jgi:hypothetical protein